jgi:hypothetical protein
MKRRRHTAEQIVRKIAGGRPAVGRGDLLPGGHQAARGLGGDVSPLTGAVRRDEGRRREAAEEARGGDARLKPNVADQTLEVVALKEIAKGNR